MPCAISAEHEARLLASIYHSSHSAQWVELRARRLQQWAAPLPPFLSQLCAGLVQAGLFSAEQPPNHVLINAYERAEGIAPHSDGPSYLPTVATLSLGSSCPMRYSVLYGREGPGEAGGQLLGELLLRPCSLVVTRGLLYTQYAHCIPEAAESALAQGALLWNAEAAQAEPGSLAVREATRVSITMRHKLCERVEEEQQQS
jgi:alkylated DNA repair protein alkB family protein 6